MEIVVHSPGLESSYAVVVGKRMIAVHPDAVPDLGCMTSEQEEVLKMHVTDDYEMNNLDGGVCAIVTRKDDEPENANATQIFAKFPWGTEAPMGIIRGNVYVVNTEQPWTFKQALGEARRLRQMLVGEARGVEVMFKTKDTHTIHWLPIPEGNDINMVCFVDPEDSNRIKSLTSHGMTQRFTIGPRGAPTGTFIASGNLIGQMF